jgi:hypothetical protein
MEVTLSLTFDLDALVIANIPGNLHRVANERASTGMLHRPFNQRIILDYVYCESRTPQTS